MAWALSDASGHAVEEGSWARAVVKMKLEASRLLRIAERRRAAAMRRHVQEATRAMRGKAGPNKAYKRLKAIPA